MTTKIAEYISCITCEEPLVYEYIEANIGITIELPYCPNITCIRYKLFTMEPDV